MKNIINTFIFCLAIFIPKVSQACSCDYFTNFCETLSPTATVIIGKTFDKYIIPVFDQWGPGYVDIVVSEYLNNELTYDTLSVLVGWGTSCDPSFDAFSVGDELIIGFEENPIDPEYGHFKEIKLQGACSLNFLFVKDHPLEAFKKDLEDCLMTTFIPEPHHLNHLVQVFPNPTSDKVLIHSPSDLGSLNLELLSATGQLLVSDKPTISENYEFDLSQFPRGVYFLKIKIEDVFVTKKILKY